MANFPDTRIKFTVTRNGAPVWSIEGQGLDDREMITGVAQAIYECRWYRDAGEPDFVFTFDGKGEQYFQYDPKTKQNMVLRDHFEFTDVHNMRRYAGMSHHLVKTLQDDFRRMPGAYIGSYVWLDKLTFDKGFEGSVTIFKTPRFIQGFIMGCNACGVDFRTMKHGKPFRVDKDGHITYYDIEGYPMTNPPDLPTQV